MDGGMSGWTGKKSYTEMVEGPLPQKKPRNGAVEIQLLGLSWLFVPAEMKQGGVGAREQRVSSEVSGEGPGL